jgi:hypothetical protein
MYGKTQEKEQPKPTLPHKCTYDLKVIRSEFKNGGGGIVENCLLSEDPITRSRRGSKLTKSPDQVFVTIYIPPFKIIFGAYKAFEAADEARKHQQHFQHNAFHAALKAFTGLQSHFADEEDPDLA